MTSQKLKFEVVETTLKIIILLKQPQSNSPQIQFFKLAYISKQVSYNSYLTVLVFLWQVYESRDT